MIIENMVDKVIKNMMKKVDDEDKMLIKSIKSYKDK